jgi:DNA-binding SARP family transcriptional activator
MHDYKRDNARSGAISACCPLEQILSITLGLRPFARTEKLYRSIQSGGAAL